MKFTIKGRFPSLNEYTSANRSNRYAGSKMKKDCHKQVIEAIKEHKLPKVKSYPIALKITWFEKDRRRDIDNVTYGVKFINDSLVEVKIIQDDSQQYVKSIINHIEVDRQNPRIEVEIIERKLND